MILDGGLASQLESQGHDLGTPLWTAALVRDNPQAIVDAHRAYLDAGADCIISSSYQAHRSNLAEQGYSADDADALLTKSVQLARQSVDEFMADNPGAKQPRVAASVGPYGAAQGDGSEYTGAYDTDDAGLLEFHEQRLKLLDESGADILACETIPNRIEAYILAQLLLDTKTPAWVSFSCKDGRTISDGSPLAEVASMFAMHPTVFAVGANCTSPEYISSLIDEIRYAAPDKLVVVYPNSGEKFDEIEENWHGDVSDHDLAAESRKWRSAGASIIGGCCRTGPADIKAIKGALQS